MPDLPRPRRLTKRQVERLLETYDSDPVASLTEALAPLVSGPSGSWEQILEALPVPPEMRQGLREREISVMDALVKHLVEYRALEQ